MSCCLVPLTFRACTTYLGVLASHLNSGGGFMVLKGGSDRDYAAEQTPVVCADFM